MKHLIFVAFISFMFSCNSANDKVVTNENVAMPDEAAIKTAVNNFYAALSFSGSKPLNADSLKDCFITKSQLINFIADTAQILSTDDFIKAFKNYAQTSKINFFKETEIFGKTYQFGNIAQRISTYKAFANNPDVVSERGVNSFQLIKTPGGWKVSSLVWDVEDKNLPIPKYYLPE